MKIIPEVQCRRCGQSFSALRSRCPNCGIRRVSQSTRTPAPTPGTVKGTPAYSRNETNTKWQVIFSLILVVAVILAVIVMVSTSLDSADHPDKAKNTPAPPVEASAPPVVEAPPSPSPTPTPSVEKVEIRYATTVREDFAMTMGEAPVTVNAVAYPVTIENPVFKWTCSDTDKLKITVSEDTKECTCEILQGGNTSVKLKVECFGVEKEIPVYLFGN